MFAKTFYHETLKKYVALFGTLFNDIWINRTDDNGNVTESFKVPISYSPRDKLLARIRGIDESKDPLDQEFAVLLPRIGFDVRGLTYSNERKTSTVGKFYRGNKLNDPDTQVYQYNSIPYDISFEVSILVKNTSDGTQIIEQILPFFGPEWTVTAKILNNPEVIQDIPVVIQDVTKDEDYEGAFDERRVIMWTLTFTMKANFFGPTREQKVIKIANTQLYDATLFDNIDDAIGNTDVIDRVTVYPGLTANGEPTADANTAVDPLTVEQGDNWDYVIDLSGPIIE